KTTVTIKNIESLDANNSISYGTDYKNKISITGTVNAKTSSVELNAKNTIGDKTHQVKISQYAINLLPKYLTENNYEKAADYENKAIVSGKQIPACYFVVGRTTSGSDVTVAFTTKKVGNALQLDFDPAIRPVEVFEGAESAKCSWGTYATLKEAFAEIDKSGSASKNYIIVIDTAMDGSDASTSIKENVTTASKANQITIRPADETKKYQLLTKNAITLKTNLVLKNVVIGDNKNNKGVNTKININLGNFKLFMSDVTTSEDRIGNVKGGNVNGTSAIVINNSGFDTDCPMNFFVWGNIDKVGTLKFANPAVTVLGKTNVGNLEYTGSDFGTFIGTSSVSTKKVDGSLVATKVTSNISVANKIISSKKTVEGVDVPALGICLMYKDKEQGYVTVGGDDATYSGYADNVLVHNKPFYQIVKAPKAANNSFMYVDDKQPDALTCKKNGSIYLVDENTLKENYGLYEIDNLDDTSNRVELATFATLKEAIDEINTRKDSKAYYLVAPLVEAPAPEKLIVPKAKCAAGLVFGNVSPTAELNVFTYTNDNLKLTCDTVFKDFAVYCDYKAMNFEISNYKLQFIGKCNWNYKPKQNNSLWVGSIKGSGEGKNSNVYLKNIESFEVYYDITKVGILTLDNSNIVCFKKVSLGRIDQIDGTNKFRTCVNYKQKRDSYIVTSATTNATIINGINREGGILYFGQCAHDYYFKEDYVEDIYEYQDVIDCSEIIGGTNLAMPLFKTTNGVMADEDGKSTFYYRCDDILIPSNDQRIYKKDGTVYYNTNTRKNAYDFILTDDSGKMYGNYCKYPDAINEINNILPKANYTLTVTRPYMDPDGLDARDYFDIYSIPKVSKSPV
ncbi:MAG: hypothetical protein K6E54_00430, partial [Bacteroidaceae bacterium]|nr:hypothetical protein [Bacteroidaceae bacterium]